MYNEQKRIKTECVTMGHLNCQKVLERRDGRWRLVKIIHLVYGKRYEEDIL